MEKYVIGVDSGTTVVKAGLYDMHGNEILVSSCSTPVIEEHFGWEEFDIDTDWERTASALKKLMIETYEKGIKKEQIIALGMGGKGQGVILLDSTMRPVRNAILWNDSRNVEQVGKWQKPGGVCEKIHEINGNWVMAGNMASVVPWLKANEKESLDKAATISMPTSWLSYKLTGEHKIARTDVFMMIDAKSRTYSEEIFRLLDIEDYRHLFPEPIDTWEVTGYVRKDVEESIQVPAGIPVVNIGWDVVCALAGVGALKNGEANIIMGTSNVLEVVTDELSTEPKRMGLTAVHVTPDKWVKVITPYTGMPNQNWFVDTLAYEDKAIAIREGLSIYEYFEREAGKVPVGANGVIYSPYLSAGGEGAPFTNSAARASFIGLQPHVTRPTMLRAIYEGVAFSFRHCLEAYTVPVNSIRLSGGGSKSRLWCQIMADVFNRPITKVTGTEFGIKGEAYNAAWVAGAFETQEEAMEAFTTVDEVFTPNSEAAAQYEDIFQVYKMVPDAMTDIWAKRVEFLKKYGFEG